MALVYSPHRNAHAQPLFHHRSSSTDDKDTTATSGPADGQVAKPATITHPAGKGIAKV